ncbi:MAG TPA: UxaA family hydrolase [Cellvibrio sp.]
MTQTEVSAVSRMGAVSPIILLHPGDNIVVCVKQVSAGDELIIDGEKIRVPIDIALGHKMARRTLAIGEKVYRYGAPIGSMTAPVAKGEHVHLHNMKSDYIPSHTRSRQHKDRSES